MTGYGLKYQERSNRAMLPTFKYHPNCPENEVFSKADPDTGGLPGFSRSKVNHFGILFSAESIPPLFDILKKVYHWGFFQNLQR
jgi:hypothetical protein